MYCLYCDADEVEASALLPGSKKPRRAERHGLLFTHKGGGQEVGGWGR